MSVDFSEDASGRGVEYLAALGAVSAAFELRDTDYLEVSGMSPLTGVKRLVVVVFDDDWDEWRLRVWDDGDYCPALSYHTTCAADAVDTARAMCGVESCSPRDIGE